MKPTANTEELGRSLLATVEAILETLITKADRWMLGIVARVPAPGAKQPRPARRGDARRTPVTGRKR